MALGFAGAHPAGYEVPHEKEVLRIDKFSDGELFSVTVGVDTKVLFARDNLGYLYSLDPATGDTLRKFEVPADKDEVEITLGRGEANDIVLPNDKTISNSHAKVTLRRSRDNTLSVSVSDLASSNGTDAKKHRERNAQNRVYAMVGDPLYIKPKLFPDGSTCVVGTDRGFDYGAGKPNQDGVFIKSLRDGVLVVDVIDGVGGGKKGNEAKDAALSALDSFYIEDQPKVDYKYINPGMKRHLLKRFPRNAREGFVHCLMEISPNGRVEGVSTGDVTAYALRPVLNPDGTTTYTVIKPFKEQNAKEKRNVVANFVSPGNVGDEIPFELQLEDGDILVSASDGLTANLSPEEVIEYLKAQTVDGKPVSLKNRVKLLEQAWQRRMRGLDSIKGKPDNRSLLVMEYKKSK